MTASASTRRAVRSQPTIGGPWPDRNPRAARRPRRDAGDHDGSRPRDDARDGNSAGSARCPAMRLTDVRLTSTSELTCRSQILLADDHQIFRQGLKALLERENFEVVGEASDGHEAVRLARDLQPTRRSSISPCRCSMGWMPPARFIRSPADTNGPADHAHRRPLRARGVRAGIKGYVVKTQAAADLVRAIHEVSRGQMYLSPGVSRALVDAYLAGPTHRPIR